MKNIGNKLLQPLCFIKNEVHIGQSKFGVNFAPKLLCDVYPNIDTYSSIDHCSLSKKPLHEGADFDYVKEKILGYTKEIYALNKKLQKAYKIPLNLGGDHTVAMGSIKASLDTYGKDLKVIWVDAHADIDHAEESTNKNMHEMPVNFLMHIEENLPGWFKRHKLEPEQILYIGLRDLKPYEEHILNKFSIGHISIEMLEKSNLYDLLKYFDDNNSFIHLSIDVGVLDPQIFPCTGKHSLKGLTMSEIFTILAYYKTRIVGMDLVEFNPLEFNDHDELLNSVHVAMAIIKNIHMVATSDN